MSRKFETFGAPEKGVESPKTSEVEAEKEVLKEQYGKTFGFFESYAKDFPQQLEQAKEAGDDKAVLGIEEATKENDYILKSLEAGDTNPAVKKVSEMIEQNVKFLKGEVPDGESPAKRIEILRELIDYLGELKGVEIEPKELEEVKNLVNDYSKLKNIHRSKKEIETMAKYENLGTVEFLNELTTEDSEKFVTERPEGSKNLIATPIYDEQGNFTERYKVYEQKPEIIEQKKQEIEEIAEQVKEDHEKTYTSKW